MKSLNFRYFLFFIVFVFCGNSCHGQKVLTSGSSQTESAQKTDSYENQTIDSLVIGSDKSTERKFDDLLSTPLGIPHKYKFNNQNPPEKDISSFSVGTKDSPEKSVKQTDNIKLGTPYRSKTYISESKAASDYDSRSLGMPYTVRSKLQQEAEKSGY